MVMATKERSREKTGYQPGGPAPFGALGRVPCRSPTLLDGRDEWVMLSEVAVEWAWRGQSSPTEGTAWVKVLRLAECPSC